MANVYVDSKDDHKVEEEEQTETEENVEEVIDSAEAEEACEDESCDCEADEECDCEDESCDCESEEDKKEFDYKVYGKETVEETKSMAEKMFNDVVATLKGKQTDWNKLIDDYKTKKPSVDLLEYEDNLVIKVDLPRVNKDDIDVKMTTESVEIEVEFPDDLESEEDVKVLRRERCFGKTKNIIPIPVEVDIQEVNASFENYILTITLPKVKGKKVDVEIV